jgi:iron complex transport system substrate-binding protein
VAIGVRRAIIAAFTFSAVGIFHLAGCRRAPAPPHSGVPRRIVSLAPNLTEIVFALGAGKDLVGVSEYSDYPPEALRLPRVGGLDVSAEKVASLSPDLVLATPEGNAKGPVLSLIAAGVPVQVVPGGSLDSVLQGIRDVAARLGRKDEGERLIRDLSQRRQAARSLGTSHPPRSAILLVWPDPPQAAGGGTFADDVLTESGARNLLASRPGWPVVSPEWLATAPIEVLVIPDSPATRSAYAQAFSNGPLSRGTVSRARVIRIDESALTRPGPRVFDALEQLARALSG